MPIKPQSTRAEPSPQQNDRSAQPLIPRVAAAPDEPDGAFGPEFISLPGLDHWTAMPLGTLLDAARLWIENYDARARALRREDRIAAGTERSYRHVFARLTAASAQTGETVGACAARTGSRASYRCWRCAYYWCCRQDLPGLIAQSDALQATCWSEARRLPERPVTSGHGNEALQPHDNPLESVRLELGVKLCQLMSFLEHRGVPRPALLRRRRIAGLPAAWRQMIAAALPAHHQLGFLVVAATGCRPVELARGVDISWEAHRVSATETIVTSVDFVIHGAKVTAFSGQPVRHLRFETGGPAERNRLLHMLVEKLQLGHVQGSPVVAKSSTLNWAVARVSAQLWPGRPALSLYALRYQFADDMVRFKMDREMLARALGHVHVKSSRYYTRLRASRSSATPELALSITVDATRTVRNHERDFERMPRALDREQRR